MTKEETKQCQNCKQSFIIASEDFAFYEKIKVPPPAWCPECRRKRRLLFRNERALYRRPCNLCGKEVISMYSEVAPFPVYCYSCWWGDGWDATEYGQAYDFSHPFFLQLKGLLENVPKIALMQRSSTNVAYANFLGESKNLYLSYSVVGCDGVYYSKQVDKSFRVFDSISVTGVENVYENIEGTKNYNSAHLTRCYNCIDSRFLFDCIECKNCILSSNLRNKEYYIRNKPYRKEDYLKELEAMDFGSLAKMQIFLNDFRILIENSLHKYANILKSVNVTGDNLVGAKNAKFCFDFRNLEDSKYMIRGFSMKDSMDVDLSVTSELIYEYISGGKDNSLTRFSVCAFQAANDVHYTDYCNSPSNLFGCAGLKGKQYCILNKQYTKEEYEELVPRIIQHMNDMPYVDQKGRAYRYGEFFPPELSPFAYNETIAEEYFPLTKEEALERGYKWRDPDTKEYKVTKQPSDLPDHIRDVTDDILKETIGCAHGGECHHQCTTAFKIIPEELAFYRKMNLPLPRFCPNCRHYERLKKRQPFKLWRRACQCAGVKSENGVYANTTPHHHNDGHCLNEFETSYAPERKEIVYCEQCYQAEVV